MTWVIGEQVAPCDCGADEPLDPDHLARGPYDAVCAARIADVRTLLRLLAEQRVLVPECSASADLSPTARVQAHGLTHVYLPPGARLAPSTDDAQSGAA